MDINIFHDIIIAALLLMFYLFGGWKVFITYTIIILILVILNKMWK